jgi:hypothetical protein
MQHAIDLASLPAGTYLDGPEIYSTAERKGYIPLRQSAFYAKVKQGILPAPLRFGRRSVWKVEDVRQMVADFHAGRFA